MSFCLPNDVTLLYNVDVTFCVYASNHTTDESYGRNMIYVKDIQKKRVCLNKNVFMKFIDLIKFLKSPAITSYALF
jgi:hypothetical protein